MRPFSLPAPVLATAAAAAIVVLLAVPLQVAAQQPAPVATTIADLPAPPVTIVFESDPYPLSVGNSDLYVRMTYADGTPVLGAQIAMLQQMSMHLMPTLETRYTELGDGLYTAYYQWSMTGLWWVDLNVTLADGTQFIEPYDIYVYPVPLDSAGAFRPYISARANALEKTSSAEQYVIIIPQGSMALFQIGMGDDIIPQDIRLSLAGQHILVIHNQDIADHTVGPFFIKAGETLHQNFTRTAEYQGACSIRHDAIINIVVEP